MYSRAISANTSGDNTIVPGVPGRGIRLTGVFLRNGTSGDVVTAEWYDGPSASGANFTGAIPLANTTPDYILPICGSYIYGGEGQQGWFTTSPGNALVLNLSGGDLVVGNVSYTLWP